MKRCTGLLTILLLTPILAIAATPKSKTVETENNTRLQIFLDNANFGPGKIDGQQGDFTKKALALYQQSKGMASNVISRPKAAVDTSGLDLSGVDPVFVDYSVSAGDLASVGDLPGTPAAQSKVKRLPYASVAEAVAERFHCALSFLKELNPGKTGKLKEGDQLRVPNVKPFELTAVKAIQPGSAAANELGEETGHEKTSTESSETGISVHISVKDEMLEVRTKEKVVAAFPVTVGSQQTASPIGDWKIQSITKLPNFRYDPKMLKEGERSSDFHMLPPGPNNPVGVIWIALNKKGIGIHGTNDPDSIGRSASHGCIRLANWDIVKLAELLKPGVPVTVE